MYSLDPGLVCVESDDERRNDELCDDLAEGATHSIHVLRDSLVSENN